jgi:hypothetical protein
MNNHGSYFQGLRNHFWDKIPKFFDADPGSGKDKIRIRDGKNLDPGSGINIPDPQHGNTTPNTPSREDPSPPPPHCRVVAVIYIYLQTVVLGPKLATLYHT